MAFKAGHITLPDIERRFHLSQGHLDKQCTTEHVLHIAGQLKSWELLAPHLGLDDRQIEAIKRNNDTEEGRRAATLVKWKEVYAFRATYKMIINALLAIERADLATEVCTLIAPQHIHGELDT